MIAGAIFFLFLALRAFSSPCPYAGRQGSASSPHRHLERRSGNWSRFYTPTMQPQDWISLKQDIALLIKNGSGPGLIRRAWQDSGTYSQIDGNGGPHAQSYLVKQDPLIDPLKAKYPGLSKADIISFSGAVTISAMNGPAILWRPGRNDAVDSFSAPIANHSLPAPTSNPAMLRAAFTSHMGLTDKDIVALLGAHNIGNCHLPVSGYAGPWTSTPYSFSNEYYTLLALNQTFKPQIVSYNNVSKLQYIDSRGRMMLPSDMALTNDPVFLGYVQQYATDRNLFFNDFAESFQKLLELGVSDGLGNTVDTTLMITTSQTASNSTCYPSGQTPFICVISSSDGNGNTVFTVHSLIAGWVAIGVGSQSMQNGDVIVAWRNSSNMAWTNTLSTYQHGVNINSNSAWQQIPLVVQPPVWAKLSFSAVHPNSVAVDSGLVGNSINGDITFALSNYGPIKGNIDELGGVTTFFQHDISGILTFGADTQSQSQNTTTTVLISSLTTLSVAFVVCVGLCFRRQITSAFRKYFPSSPTAPHDASRVDETAFNLVKEGALKNGPQPLASEMSDQTIQVLPEAVITQSPTLQAARVNSVDQDAHPANMGYNAPMPSAPIGFHPNVGYFQLPPGQVIHGSMSPVVSPYGAPNMYIPYQGPPALNAPHAVLQGYNAAQQQQQLSAPVYSPPRTSIGPGVSLRAFSIATTTPLPNPGEVKAAMELAQVCSQIPAPVTARPDPGAIPEKSSHLFNFNLTKTADEIQNEFQKKVEAILSGDVSVSPDFRAWTEQEVAAYFTLEGVAHDRTSSLVRLNNITGSVLKESTCDELANVLEITTYGQKKMLMLALKKLGICHDLPPLYQS